MKNIINVSNRGLTLIEIIAALSIFFILAAIGIVAFSNQNKNALLAHARALVISEINYARSKTLASEEKNSWGIHFETARIVRFKGGVYSSSDPANVAINLPGGVEISSINFGGSPDLVFERLTGRTSNIGSVRISLNSNAQASTTINIYASGIAE